MAKKQKFDNDGNELTDSPDPVTEGEAVAEVPAKPDPWEVLARIASAMEVIASNQKAAPAPDANLASMMETLSTAMVRISETNIEGSKLIASEHAKASQAVRPSNQVIPNVSVFNRRGTKLEEYQKPQLKCLMMIPWLVEWESCTREEVELLNLLEAGSYVLKAYRPHQDYGIRDC
jgi:hypothetical protein